MHSSTPPMPEQPTGPGTTLLSIIVPVYNEVLVLEELQRRMNAVVAGLGLPAEFVYVNDGSRDDSLALLERLRDADPRIAIVDLSRNYGKEIAMAAGLDHAHGDAVVIIDSDLQDPPEVIPELVQQWRAGYDVVYAKRLERQGETAFKKATAHAFYRIINKVSNVEIPLDTGDFRLLSRRAVDALRQLREQHRFMKGMFSWIGFPQTAVHYRRDPRFAGTSKWNYWHLWNLAIEGFTSFSIAPLKMATYLGLATALTAFIYGLEVIIKTLVFGNPVAGYPSLIVVILFIGGVQLVGIGIIGEYLGRIFNETKQRPLYFLNRYSAAATAPQAVPRIPAQQQ